MTDEATDPVAALNELADLLPDVDADEVPEAKPRRGLGLKLGVVVGVLAGIAAATFLAPKDEGHGEMPAGERAQSLLATLMARVEQAQAEGRVAALQAEDEMRQRFAELTKPRP